MFYDIFIKIGNLLLSIVDCFIELVQIGLVTSIFHDRFDTAMYVDYL